MAEHFSFFDPAQLPDGTYDREYNAEKFTKYFGALVTTGVMKGMGNMLAVSASGSNMLTKINTGIAFIEGKYYENDNFKDLTHDTETLGNSRIDRIVVRMDLGTDARYVKTFIKKGVPSTNPVAPTLTQTANLYEISLAQVRIVGGQTFIASNNVTDERGKDVTCPWAGSNILPNFDNAALEHLVNEVDNMYVAKEYTGDLNDLVESGFYYHTGTVSNAPYGGGGQVQVIATPDGFIEQVWSSTVNVLTGRLSFSRVGKLNGGVVQWNKLTSGANGNGWKTMNAILSDATDMASPTTAASSNAVKQVNDKLDSYILTGYGSPQGSRAAPPGTLHLSTQGGAATTLYVKISGTGNTGWNRVSTIT